MGGTARASATGSSPGRCNGGSACTSSRSTRSRPSGSAADVGSVHRGSMGLFQVTMLANDMVSTVRQGLFQQVRGRWGRAKPPLVGRDGSLIVTGPLPR